MPRKKANDNTPKRQLQLLHLFPNMVTILGLCVGLSSLRYALEGRYELAVGAVIVAAIIDMLDGRLARMLNAASDFGAQLDSLCDLVNFGIAPMFILYTWSLSELGGVGWACALFFAVCCMIRLARFNLHLDHEELRAAWSDRFFTGVPAPAGGLILLLPLAITFAAREDFPEEVTWLYASIMPEHLAVLAGVSGLLMVSRFPTLSLKRIEISRHLAPLILAAFGLLMVVAITKTWLFLVCAGLAYVTTLPIVAVTVWWRYREQTS